MKASELVEQLNVLIKNHGDLDVYLADWSECYEDPGKAMTVRYSSDKFIIDA